MPPKKYGIPPWNVFIACALCMFTTVFRPTSRPSTYHSLSARPPVGDSLKCSTTVNQRPTGMRRAGKMSRWPAVDWYLRVRTSIRPARPSMTRPV
jgi:hypothetical protein